MDVLFSLSNVPHLVPTTREHFSYAITLDVPVFVVINKIDLCSKTIIGETIECLTKLLKEASGSTQLEASVVSEEKDLLEAVNKFVDKRSCPIFAISCVTGENLGLLKKFLNILPPRLTINEQERLSQLPVEYRVGFLLQGSFTLCIVFGGVDRRDIHAQFSGWNHRWRNIAMVRVARSFHALKVSSSVQWHHSRGREFSHRSTDRRKFLAG